MAKVTKQPAAKLTITQVSYVDLNDLYVSRVEEGKKRATRVPMTVREFIEHVSSYGLDGTVACDFDYQDSYSSGANLAITTIRQETDEEYATRMELLAKIEQAKKDNAKQKCIKQDEQEIALLKKLMKKHKGKLNEF